MINVTKTFLPTQAEYQTVLQRAWDTGWMTNRGELVQELETKLKAHLAIPNIIATTNGTLPLQIAIKALGVTGEVITTPFSYVATTSSLVWEGCTPVFVDIHPEYLTIDETKIEAAITPNTTAILATHVFGNPCAVDEIERIANTHNLKVIYDAAHCFGVTYKGKSVFNYGDVSTCSFHATKVFHTGEGGALITKNAQLHNTLFQHHNFGHNGPEAFESVGVNAKMSELQAAMGLAVLPHMTEITKARKAICEMYTDGFKHTSLQLLQLREQTVWNYSYYPVVCANEIQLLNIVEQLNANNIYPRRYFYPSLNTLDYVTEQACPVSENISKRVLCLPLYYGLSKENVTKIIHIVKMNVC
mgnify:CR=1 FL=1